MKNNLIIFVNDEEEDGTPPPEVEDKLLSEKSEMEVGEARGGEGNDWEGLERCVRLLLALDGLEASRSRASEARTRADDAADDPSAVAAAGRREDVEGVADACAAATACSGVSTATSGNSGTLDGSAASACVSSVDVTLDAQPTLGSVAGSGEAVVPMGMPVDGATPPTLGAGSTPSSGAPPSPPPLLTPARWFHFSSAML